jgi:hypothetical protein
MATHEPRRIERSRRRAAKRRDYESHTGTREDFFRDLRRATRRLSDEPEKERA